ncbi:MAG: LacI family DNA-binding transcriptional regulator [Fimbriimonadaceae bacterium]|nr:LacI family DNA-binding transcriptional regulator [Fimbriimonadaceae bacterium]
MAVTLKDVAKAAGVSPMAVSKALHGAGSNVRVSPDTIEHIRRVAQQLNYRPNVLARSLRLRQTHCIGVVFENFPELIGDIAYYNELLTGIMRAAFPKRFSVTLCNQLIGEFSENALADGRFDGLIWCRDTPGDELESTAKRIGLPIVVLHETREATGTSAHVGWDNANASAALADHLFALGHRRAGFFLPHRSGNNPEARERMDGFFRRWKLLGGEVRDTDWLAWPDNAEGFAEWWDARPDQTALVGWNELCAIELLRTAERHRVSVPAQLSIVGFDSTPKCNTTLPPLTAVRQPLVDMGQAATNLLIQRITDPESAPVRLVFPGTLDVRASTARPPLDEEISS